jgi:hypothetical protein
MKLDEMKVNRPKPVKLKIENELDRDKFIKYCNNNDEIILFYTGDYVDKDNIKIGEEYKILPWKQGNLVYPYNEEPYLNETNKNLFSKQWWKEALQLNESPPINFEDDDNYEYVEDNLGAINKAALYFNIPVDDLQYAFDAGQNVILNDDVWSKLENTNSYHIESLGQVILHAKQHNIDITPYLKAIKNKQLLPKPLILRYESNRYYLVAGDLILSLYKALNQTPEVLQATLNLNINESLEPESRTNLVEDFINYCKDKLQLSQTPKIEFSDDTNHVKEQCSFGYFSPESKAIWVYAGDRNMADIFRTLAHELVHRKQDEDGRIEYESGKTGSDIENEANSMAGVILREFGKSNPEIYDTPIHGFIKSDLNEMKVHSPKINFIFPFIVKDKSQVPYIVDQLNKQGYSLLSRNEIRKNELNFRE